MPRTRECDFCGADIEPGTGTMLVLNDGSTHHFCSAKCEKNVDLGREARDLEWTESGQRQSGGQTQAEPEPVEAIETDEESTDANTEDEQSEESGADEADADDESANGASGESEESSEAEADSETETDAEEDET